MEHSLAQARAGHGPSVAAVVETLRPRITRMAAHYARRTGHDEDDLLQEAWIGLLEALPGLRLDIGAPQMHLVQRARWRLLDAVRRERIRRCVPLDDACAAAMPLAPDASLDAALVRAFVRSLTPTQRGVLRCILMGLTWREAGDALGCTSANIAHHMRRIRREFRHWADLSETA